MSYGIFIENPLGKLVLNSERITPWLIGKASLTSTGSTNAFDASSDRITPFYYSIPGSGPRLIAMTLPTHSNVVKYTPPLASNTDSNTSITALHNVSQTPTAPELYVFSTSGVTSSDNYGLKIMNQSSQVVFSSAIKPLMIIEVISRSDGRFSSSYSLTNMASKPAFLLPYYGSNEAVAGSETLQDNTIEYFTDFFDYFPFYSRISSTLYYESKSTNSSRTYNTQQNAFYELGTIENAAIVHINATLLD